MLLSLPGLPGGPAHLSERPATLIIMTSALTLPVPATAGMPGYAAYPVRYLARDESGRTLCRHADYAKADNWTRGYFAGRGITHRMHAAHQAPDGQVVITDRFPTGTEAGLCGSTRWIIDHDLRHRQATLFFCALSGEPPVIQHGHGLRDKPRDTQVWWVSGDERAQRWDGFRAECLQPHQHAGTCQALNWRWDSNLFVPLPDAG